MLIDAIFCHSSRLLVKNVFVSMSAIVAALNGHAAAIAADSAVTIGGRKVFNSANKIFTLSKYAPVAIAIYNNTSLMDIPWEIIIKEYRKYLGDNIKPNLKDYANDFFSFLKTKGYYSDSAKQKNFLLSHFTIYLDAIVKEIDPSKPDFENRLISSINDVISKHTKPLVCFSHISKDEFFKYNKDILEHSSFDFNNKYSINLNLDLISSLLYSIFVCAQLQAFVTGLVFIGYGEDELFPSLYCYENCFIVNGILSSIHISNKDGIIKTGVDAAVCPFAQTDVMDTIVRGIAPQVEDIFVKNYSIPIKKVFGDMAKIVQADNPTLANNIRNFINNNLGNYEKEYFKACHDLTSRDYIAPLINSVVTLDKEDLADFVESLIKLTSIKRKISPDQPTVGGPIDVMVISKGDGIIWMRRKHYFKPELNNHFFQNYFRQ